MYYKKIEDQYGNMKANRLAKLDKILSGIILNIELKHCTGLVFFFRYFYLYLVSYLYNK